MIREQKEKANRDLQIEEEFKEKNSDYLKIKKGKIREKTIRYLETN